MFQLVTLAPGHFHAALIQKQMHVGVDPHALVFGPLDADLAAHLARVAAFNQRAENPTYWSLDVKAGADWRNAFGRIEQRPRIAVISGRNRDKLDLIQLALNAGMHVLADKPWMIDAADLTKLSDILACADNAGLLVYDIMTERYEITSILQREIVRDRDLFGDVELGDAMNPAIAMESVHYLKKLVAGVPLRRPGWFFDVAVQGEALADVGPHLVDQVLWMLFTDRPIDIRREIAILKSERWPTILDRDQFAGITGLADFPAELRPSLNAGRLPYGCNNRVVFAMRGVHVRLDVVWDYEAPPGGGDTHNAVIRGNRCTAAIRQRGGQSAELFVSPTGATRAETKARLTERVANWQSRFPGVTLEDAGDEFHIAIPSVHRTGHEAHFAEVTAQFLSYVQGIDRVPTWEAPNLLAKYLVTTKGVAPAPTRSVRDGFPR